METLEKELSQFLTLDAAPSLKCVAMENVMGLTGSDKGLIFICDSETLLSALVVLTTDKIKDVREMAVKALINIATKEDPAFRVLRAKKCDSLIPEWFEYVLDPSSKDADLMCQMLSNITRSEKCAEKVGKVLLKDSKTVIEKLVKALCTVKYNENADLHYLAAVLANLSQSRDVRLVLMDREQCIIQRLLPFTEFHESTIRRHGIIGTLKNCCFDTENHEWLLSDKVDLLPRLLLPLAGPEEFDDDDNDRLPDDLQYLPAEKERESVADIRKMLVEALIQLCATRNGRNYLKEKNAYVIMREYYAWERKHEPANEITAMNLIDILIGDDPTDEFGDNLKTVDIPDDLQKQFHDEDEKERKQADVEKQERDAQTTQDT